jgi:hypothetical protein
MSPRNRPRSGGEAAPVAPTAAPREVRASFALWLAAVAAGVFETALAVVQAASVGPALDAGLVVGVGVRLLVFASVVYAASRMLRGRNWARVALAVGLGVLGTLSIVVGPLSWLAGGHTVGEFLAGAGPVPLLFAASRAAHLIAVFAALTFMFRPAANGYFRAAGRRTPGRTTPDGRGARSRP